MNRNLLIGGIVVVLLLSGGIFFMARKMPTTPTTFTPTNTSSTSTNSQDAMKKNNVVIENFTFSPSTITVYPGDTVTWTNQDTAPHSATADDGSFDTGVMQKGESKTVTFSSIGTFPYHCSVHPNMKAKVVVQ